jgi:hypothetical protein
VLSTPVELVEDNQFSVAVKLTTPGWPYPIPIEHTVVGYSSAAGAFPGESFISSDGGSWMDATTAWDYSTNVCIKAFTSNMNDTLAAAVLPTSRSVQVGNTATAFGTIINAGSATATDCGIAPLASVQADFSYQTTDPATNALVGTANTPVDIVPGGFQSYVFAFSPTAAFDTTDVQLTFDCFNTNPAPVTVGLNTLLLSASSTPVSDIVALSATPTGDGIVDLPGSSGANAFAVATVNVGSQDMITASADTGSAALPVTLSICESVPATGECLAPPVSSVTTAINAGATPTFSIFVAGAGSVPFDPANNRVFVRFRDSGDITRGSTSVAVRTQYGN